MAASKSGNTRQLSNPSAACHPHAICKIRSARSDQTLLPGCSSPLMRLSEHRRCFKPGEQKAWSGEAPTAPPLRAVEKRSPWSVRLRHARLPPPVVGSYPRPYFARHIKLVEDVFTPLDMPTPVAWCVSSAAPPPARSFTLPCLKFMRSFEPARVLSSLHSVTPHQCGLFRENSTKLIFCFKGVWAFARRCMGLTTSLWLKQSDYELGC